MGQVDFAALRSAMVASQLRPSDVSDAGVISAMLQVPREDFVPAALREVVYIDRSVPLGNGRIINPPLATGRLLSEAAIIPGNKVLLLNDATGYTAALLDAMGAIVTVVDVTSRPANVPAAVTWVEGNPGKGLAAGAPYDIIVIDGAVEVFPDALAPQLVDGGRIVTGLIDGAVTHLVVAVKVGDALGQNRIAEIEMAPVAGFGAKEPAFQF